MNSTSDAQELKLVSLFCAGASLRACLSAFCRDCQAQDPILHVTLTAINSPVQIQLTGVGLQPFQGAEFTLPYHRMSPEQRAFLLELTMDEAAWSVHETSMVWRRRGARTTLAAVDVLEAVCAQLLAARKTHADPRARVAVCNILLQRAQASVPLSPALQAELNARLFPEREAGPPEAPAAI
jgi:hypothetical protein